MRTWLWFGIGSLLLTASAAEARVFSYKDAELAAYVRGTGGFSQLAQDAFANEGGAGATVTGTSKMNYGAELGMAFGLGPNTHLRMGAEVIQHSPVNGDGESALGLKYYTLSSSVFVFNPNIVLEQVYSVHGVMRYYFTLGVGYAMVTATNDYKMSDAGASQYGGLMDFKETMEANVISGQAGVGLETLFTDNVTFMADIGYRYLPVREMKYKADVINFNGSASKGDIVTNSDGSKRTLNLGGLFAGIAFRFYLNFL